MVKKYLVYLDILGFEDLAKEIAGKRGINQRKVRRDFIATIEDRLDAPEVEGVITGKKYGNADDWILVTDALDNAFYCIAEILDHNTNYDDYKYIPIEFAIGTGDYDRWAKFEGKELIVEDETISFLRTYIINHYQNWYMEENLSGESLKSSFVILTDSVYHELPLLDRRRCARIERTLENEDGKEEVITFYHAHLNKIRDRGKIVKFLDEIGYPGHKFYGRINEAYVPPSEYYEIVNALKAKRIVFITGTQEYGKTFTAVRLMWEYYKNEYEPVWLKGREESERIEVRNRLDNINAELKPKRIIYFEDPFGQTKYEKRESLEREFGTIIDSVRQVNDVFVILTSREEVFKEFGKEKLSAKDLEAFERRLNIKRPSYNYDRRRQILLNWAEELNCRWLENQDLKKLVFDAMKNESILPTPLSIKEFASATFDIQTEYGLKNELREKSRDTAKAFAREIKNMTQDKILFLSFPFISEYFDVDFVREVYQDLVEELKLKAAWEFDRFFKWFEEDKINITQRLFENRTIEFAHPSYHEALDYILVEDGHPTQINREIFCTLLFRLADDDKAARAVARTVAEHFEALPVEVRNQLLLKLAEKDGAAEAVAGAVVKNFDRLPVEVRNQLFKLAEKDGAAEAVAGAVVKNFDRLPVEVRNQLLLKLAKKYKTAEYVAWAVAENFGSLPEEVRNLLFKLAEKDGAAEGVGSAVAKNFDRLPVEVRNQLLFKLSEKDKAAWDVARTVMMNFDRLPVEVRNQLLFKLSERDGAATTVAGALEGNFDRLPVEVRNQLLFKLSERVGATEAVARAVVDNFEILYDELREILFKLSERVVRAMLVHFDELPENVRNQLLLKLAEREEVADMVVRSMLLHFDELPENVRNQLLLKLAEREEVAAIVARTVARHFDDLPEEVRSLLVIERVKKAFQKDIRELTVWEKEYALNLISKAWTKIDIDFVLGILKKMSECKNEKVRMRASGLIRQISEEKK